MHTTIKLKFGPFWGEGKSFFLKYIESDHSIGQAENQRINEVLFN